MKFNFRLIFRLLGILILFNGLFMAICLPFSIYYKEDTTTSIIISSCITILIGALFLFFFRDREDKELRKRDGYLIVTFGWLAMSFTGTIPYILSGAIPEFTNAFFETMSGYTTTGASILTDIESLPRGILFWRSLTQWIGGMGIIVLTVAILPILGIGGMQLFVAEAPGISPDKLKPRIRETAIRLWMIYLSLTGLEMVLLKIGGMSFFDAINHALTTMATGGFSTKNASIAHFNSPFIHYIIVVFMFLAGTNFTLTYFGLHGQIKKIWKNEEFRFYSVSVLIISIVVGIVIYRATDYNLESSLRNSVFSIVSIISTTGYVTVDYTSWNPQITMFFFMLMFIGASAGSTAGGVKIVRHVILVKNSFLELKRLIHPNAVLPLRFNHKVVTKDITFNVLAFMIIYIMVFATGSVIMSYLGVDFMTAVGSVATSIGNIGPGIGTVGPVNNFAHMPLMGKWFLSFLMLLGRLELFTVLILFTPYFWRKY
jgi:trk system potassium uptake protein TrkH